MDDRELIKQQLKIIRGTINHLANLNNTKISLELSENTKVNQFKLAKVEFEIARCQKNLDNMVKELIGENHYINNVESVKTK